MTWLHLPCLTADCSAEPITAFAQLVPSRSTVLAYVLPPAENRLGKSSARVSASGSAARVSICPQGPSDGDGDGEAVCVRAGDERGLPGRGGGLAWIPAARSSQKYAAAAGHQGQHQPAGEQHPARPLRATRPGVRAPAWRPVRSRPVRACRRTKRCLRCLRQAAGVAASAGRAGLRALVAVTAGVGSGPAGPSGIGALGQAGQPGGRAPALRRGSAEARGSAQPLAAGEASTTSQDWVAVTSAAGSLTASTE